MKKKNLFDTEEFYKPENRKEITGEADMERFLTIISVLFILCIIGLIIIVLFT